MPDRKCIYLMCGIYVAALLVPAVAGAAVPDPTVLWWKFDEGTGTVAKDSSGKGHDGVITGAAWKSGGVGGLGYCLDFPGKVTPMVEDQSAPSYLNGLGAITVALWVKSRVTNTDNGFIICETPAGNDSFVTMRYDASGSNGGGTNVLKMAVTSTSGEQQLESSSGLQTTEWHHVALTWKGGVGLSFYSNGKLDKPTNVQAVNTGTVSGVKTLIVGRGAKDVSGNPGNGWNGLIDDVRIYDFVLTEAQIAELVANKPLTLKATEPNPADGATAVSAPLFQWKKGDTAIFHNVYLGTTPDLTAANLVAPNQPFNMYFHVVGLMPGVVNYWRVDEVEADGTIRKGDVWQFTATPKTAWAANPGDGAAYVAPNVALAWSAGMNATTHDVYLGADRAAVEAGAPETKKGSNLATATFTPTGLERSKTYYWRVDELLAGGAKVAGSVWSFTVRPIIAKVDPNMVGWWKLDDEKNGMAVDYSGSDNYGTLKGPKWVEGILGDALQFSGADWVDLPPALMKSKLGSVTCWVKTTQTTIGMIVYGNAVTSGNGYGDQSEIHLAVDTSQARFYIEGGASDVSIRSPSPINNGEWQHLAAVWDATTVVLYVNGAKVGQTSNTAPAFTGAGMTRMGRPADSERYYNGLLDDVRLYSRALSADEITQAMRGDPLMAWGPQPKTNTTVDIRDAASLSWSAGDNAAKHDVYFGKDKDAVKAADTTSPLYQGRQTGKSLSLDGKVEFGGGTYFWRVDEVEADGATIHKGTVWSFTIPAYLMVDDFEGYNDQAGSEIFSTWIDGFADNFASSRSTVGKDTASAGTFGETTIVHGGRQSMPMAYDNSQKPYFSEAVQTFAPLQDWTGNGVTTLSLFWRGVAANGADKLYVMVEDSTGKQAVVANADPAAAKVATWTEWKIPLSSLTGVNLAKVKKLYLGVGDRKAPAVGGKGTIYIDDIRVVK